eukprot:762898-Hanusia_phi.AAC.1
MSRKAFDLLLSHIRDDLLRDHVKATAQSQVFLKGPQSFRALSVHDPSVACWWIGFVHAWEVRRTTGKRAGGRWYWGFEGSTRSDELLIRGINKDERAKMISASCRIPDSARCLPMSYNSQLASLVLRHLGVFLVQILLQTPQLLPLPSASSHLPRENRHLILLQALLQVLLGDSLLLNELLIRHLALLDATLNLQEIIRSAARAVRACTDRGKLLFERLETFRSLARLLRMSVQARRMPVLGRRSGARGTRV